MSMHRTILHTRVTQSGWAAPRHMRVGIVCIRQICRWTRPCHSDTRRGSACMVRYGTIGRNNPRWCRRILGLSLLLVLKTIMFHRIVVTIKQERVGKLEITPTLGILSRDYTLM